MDINEKIARAIEPDPPEITTDDWGQAVVLGETYSVLPWGDLDFSPNRGWYLIEVYGDPGPKWFPRRFDRDFRDAVEAYEKLVDGYLIIERGSDSWIAYNAYDETYLNDDDDRYFRHDDNDAGYGDTAAEAICDIIVRKACINV